MRPIWVTQTTANVEAFQAGLEIVNKYLNGYTSLLSFVVKEDNFDKLKERKTSKMHVRLYVGIEDTDSPN